MRRTASFFIPLGCVMASLAVVAACEDDPNPAGGDFDAQAPTFDADRPSTDGGLPDTNAPDVDAGAAPVTVNVRTPGGQPLAGATVVFGSATGDVIQSVTSDATGTATALVPSGSQVTVVFSTPDEPRLVTITAVEPGDVIVASDLSATANEQTGTVTITAQVDGGPGATYYRYSSGDCLVGTFFSDTPPFEYGLTRDCINAQGKIPVLAEGRDEGDQPTGFQFVKNLTAPTDGGTVTPAFGAWSTAVTQQTVSATNLHQDGGSNAIAFAEIADGVMHTDYNYVGGEPTGEATFRVHTGYADAVQYEVYVDLSTSASGDSLVGNVTRVATPTMNGTSNVDFGTRLPEITGSAVDGGAPSRPAITWTPSGSLAAADGTYVVVRWIETTDGGERTGTWTFVTPPSASSVTAPALPANVSSAPGAQANFGYFDVTPVITVEASFVNGYAEFRKAAGVIAPTRNLVDHRSGMHVPALPVNGTVKYTAFTSNGD